MVEELEAMGGGCENIYSSDSHQDTGGGYSAMTGERRGAIFGHLWISEME